MKDILWLDDYRDPIKFLRKFTPYSYDDNRVIWVKDEDEFKHYIDNYGVPDVISFDHDLGPENEVGSGFTCTKYLVEKLMNDGFKDFPEYYVHSSNPVGRNNIDGLIESYRKYIKRFRK